MTKYMLISRALLAAGICAAGVSAASAGNSKDVDETAEMQSLNSVKLSAVQAAQAAESKFGGKVSSVVFQGSSASTPDPFYHVELASADGNQHDVAVDANSGEVMRLLAKEAGNDHEDHGIEDKDGGDHERRDENE